jgi:hypothetical protein
MRTREQLPAAERLGARCAAIALALAIIALRPRGAMARTLVPGAS